MADCVNPQCRAQIPDDYAFCPLCGTDNRPPEKRAAVHDGAHVFPPTAKFCINCGEPRDQRYTSVKHVWRIRLGSVLVLLALALAAFAILCAYYTFGNGNAQTEIGAERSETQPISDF